MEDNNTKFTLVLSDLTYEEKEAIKAYLRSTYPNLIDDALEKEKIQEESNDQK